MLLKRFLRLLICIVIAFIFVRTSTYGWRCWGQGSMDANKENINLAKRLESHVYKLSYDIGDRSAFKYEKLLQAQKYIEKQLISFGYKVEFQSYRVDGKEVKNIIAAKEGISHPKRIIILGAHYDSCFNPGADDNGSGVAGLLEIARNLHKEETNKTIKFIAFVNEEPPFFKTDNMGSRVYSKAAKERKEDIEAVIILEMIGYYTNMPNSQKYPPLFGFFYPNKGNFITAAGNFKYNRLLKKVVSIFKKNSKFPIESIAAFDFVPGIDFSDHWSFWQEGYPAVMLTDTAFYRNPNYHQPSDIYDTLDYSSMAEVVKGMELVVKDIAK